MLVAFSGGADSTALAVVLRGLRYPIVLGHVDHQMRPESRAEAEHCAAVASLLEAPFEFTTVEVDPPREAEARRARYDALEEMADRVGAAKIATGHTLDDHLETILMRINRGGSAFGIPVRRGRAVRPLIHLHRYETEAACASAGLTFIRDPSNEDERIERNRVRRRVVPNMSEDEILIVLGAARANELAAAVFDCEVAEAERGGRLIFDDTEARIDRRWLVNESEAKRRGVLRRSMEAIGIEPSSRLVTDVDRKVVTTTGSRLDLPGGWSIWAEPETLVIGRPSPPPKLPEVSIAVPGVTVSPEWGLEIRTRIVGPGAPGPAARADRGRPSQRFAHVAEAFFDGDAAGDVLALRPRRAGDRFRPLGIDGSKKLQDYLVDSKVPRRERPRVPIIEANGRIVWVVGHRIDDRFKVTEQTQRALRIQIFPFLRDEPGAR